jgi:glycyl-tRNA synthetase
MVPDDPALVREEANLVEQPNALLGAFDADYLALPEAVLVTVMKKHQRYFALRGPDGALLPHFIAVANGSALDAAAVRHGNEAVLAARFADAGYFWRQDAAKRLDDFTPALAGLAFQADLGSMLDKVRRLEQLAPNLGTRLGLSAVELATTQRAAALSKSDLTSSMVVDFTSLQGVMGREYARLGGESEAVAAALYEQYLPRGAGDELPTTAAGTMLALADRLDSLVGLFAVGLRPTGAQDPYGLRRAAGSLATLLIGRGLDLDLADAVADAAASLPLPVGTATGDEVLDFVAKRLEGQLREAGHGADAVAAVLAVQGRNPHRAAQTVALLEQHIARADWDTTLTAYARCARLVRAQATPPGAVDAALFTVPAESVLHEASAAVTESLDRTDPNAVLHALAALAPAVNTFFDEVLVMAEDPAVRANRLALVAGVAGLAAGVADLSLLEGF